jgi:hypothetical protein
VRPLHGPGGTGREDSSLHLLAAEPVDYQRFGTVRRTDHRDAGIPAGQDNPSCLPRLSLPGRMCGKTRAAGQHRSAGSFLPIRTRRHHRHGVGACERTGSPQGWVGVYNDRVGAVSPTWPNRPSLMASPAQRPSTRLTVNVPSARSVVLGTTCPTAGALDAPLWRSD